MSDHRVMIVVTHLLGVGHLARMAAVGAAMAARGWKVTLVSGGRPAPTVALDGLELVALPPVHCVGTDFATLYAAPGLVADADYFTRRREALLAAFDAARPEALITELYPFGRRSLAGEFDALLAHAHGRADRPAVLCSIRDVLNPPSRPERAEATLACLGRFYDGVLFHGAADVVPLSASWPEAKRLNNRLRETGYVHDGSRQVSTSDEAGAGEIIVSGGGSAAGLPLALASLQAARLVPEKRWRLLVGGSVPGETLDALKAEAPANMIVERARPDFPALLARGAASISQAGYNTVLDLAAANARAVLVPFAEGGEKEQTIRAGELARRGLARHLPAEALTPETLAAALRELLARPAPDWHGIGRAGAAKTADIVADEIARRAVARAGWAHLDAALGRARAARRTLDFWWRDDDATEPTPALEALLANRRRWKVPLALAVIPDRATPALAERLATETGVDVLVHGWAHANHAPPGSKKAEFGPHRPMDVMVEQVREGRRRIEALFGARALPVFVPPWNRIDPELAGRLSGAGYRVLSTYKRRSPAALPGLTEINTHWDPIDWHGGGGLVEEGKLLKQLAVLIEDELAAAPGTLEPIGVLTHHLVHDRWIEGFLDALMARLLGSGVARFRSLAQETGAQNTRAEG
ncbi:glycosyltransferase [Ancylobacter pratisalsi]|uniref:Glycosyl transferase family 28 n=1 Tax=Ancylobacter pratisalsi TaxID=1745854 RepID=A0A6P1YTB2_9HYPH|nr:glycosyltransferase [Ancylobacter pratisalsi]QIB35956.1 glycosyl transferase family 28 [Ancylobacter pratisalsi]